MGTESLRGIWNWKIVGVGHVYRRYMGVGHVAGK